MTLLKGISGFRSSSSELLKSSSTRSSTDFWDACADCFVEALGMRIHILREIYRDVVGHLEGYEEEKIHGLLLTQKATNIN